MATAEQIKSLIKSHLQNDSKRFLTTSLQLVAYEAHRGHTTLARDIRWLIDKQKANRLKVVSFHKDLSDFIHSSKSQHRLADIVLTSELKGQIDKILKKYYQRQKLLKHGLSNRRKVLWAGPPWTGKILTASVIARERKYQINP